MYTRLKLLIQELGLTQRQFAQKIYLDPGYLSRILQGKIQPPERILLLIEKTFHVNPQWLRTGEGDIFAESELSSEKRRLLAAIDELDESQLQALSAFLRYLKEERKASDLTSPIEEKEASDS